MIVTVEGSGEVELAEGSPLLDLEPLIRFGCRAGACGSCAIQIKSGDAALSAMSPKEQRALEVMNFKLEKTRLACQVKCHGDCTVMRVKRGKL